MMQSNAPFSFPGSDEEQPRLARSFLKDQMTGILRDYIVSGRIPPGTKLIEREVGAQLGVSRAPVRDALTELEKEGLVVTKRNGRFVINLTKQDVRELYQIRLVLERLAVTSGCPEQHARELRAAQPVPATDEGSNLPSRSCQAHQGRCRHALVGLAAGEQPTPAADAQLDDRPRFMFVANNASAYDWEETLALHEEMVACINAGNVTTAVESMERHLDNALHRSLRCSKTQNRGGNAVTRPHLLFLLADQMRPDALAQAITPHLDALAARGVRFDNAYCASPLCQPSRACIVTGRYPTQHGVYGNMNEPIQSQERHDTYPSQLQRAGYYTAMIGKHHYYDRWAVGMDVLEDDAESAGVWLRPCMAGG